MSLFCGLYASALFEFRGNFKKGTVFYIVFRNLSFVNQPGFLWHISHKNPGFSFSKRALILSCPCQAVLLFDGGRLFRFLLEIFCARKGHRRKWRLKVKNPNKANSKHKRTRPEYRAHTGPPQRSETPNCTELPLCNGCPFPGHGFLCRGENGECMRTRLSKISVRRGDIE